MPIADILIRSISGYIFIIPGILMYYLYLRKQNKKQTLLHMIVVFIFLLLLYWSFNEKQGEVPDFKAM